ncbi:MAG: TSUP family transporter [Phycisphaera sp.]|nr:TSUP family transporter [Phycisphaera sp.]
MIWAWLGALAVGLSLGLLGSGGAILTTPILVYLVGHDEKAAIAESLAIVGAIALAGVLRAWPQGRVDFRSALLLALPGIVGTSLGAQLSVFLSGAVQLAMLAVLMLTAATLMFRRGRGEPAAGVETSVRAGQPGQDASALAYGGLSSQWKIVLQGTGLGLATGLVGVGGGFLIVPVLVLLRRLPMPTAIGTSLAIIAVNSAVGFGQYLWLIRGAEAPSGTALKVDWFVIGTFVVLGVGGSLVGNHLSGRLYHGTLKRIFAVFLVLMAGFILVRQAPRVFPGVFGPSTANSGDSTAASTGFGTAEGTQASQSSPRSAPAASEGGR